MAQMSRAHDPQKTGAVILVPVTVGSWRHETPSKCAMPVGPATHTSSSALPQIECHELIETRSADALSHAAPVQRNTPGEPTPLTSQYAVAHASCDGESQTSVTRKVPPVNESGGVLSVQDDPSQWNSRPDRPEARGAAPSHTSSGARPANVRTACEESTSNSGGVASDQVAPFQWLRRVPPTHTSLGEDPQSAK